MLVGPVVLALYEPAVGTVRWRDGIGFPVRAGVLGLIASLWWVVPVLVHVHYGINFLQYTEQPATIWGTNSLTESLRLMGYWTSYLGVGFGINRPFLDRRLDAALQPVVVTARCCCRRSPWPGSWRAGGSATRRCCCSWCRGHDRDGRLPRRTPVRRTMVWGSNEHIFVLQLHAHDQQGGAAGRRRGGGPARARGARTDRRAARARTISAPAAAPVRGRPPDCAGGTDRARRAAADPRQGDRHPALLQDGFPQPVTRQGLDLNRTCPHAGDGPARVRSSPTTLGRHAGTRSCPVSPPQPGGRALRDPVLGPARR